MPILPEGSGRVAEVKVGYSAEVKKGDVLFTLDSSKQQAALDTAKRKVAEVDAQLVSAKVDVDQGGGPDPAGQQPTSSRPRTSST